jgi:hypothetical protein
MYDSYDVAQVCANGHIANASVHDAPQFNQNYCDKCGERTITVCPSCSKSIRGRYRDLITLATYEAPSFCQYCGHPFPWTERALTAANEYVKELDSIEQEDRDRLIVSIQELTKDGPTSALAATRFKRLVDKAGLEAYQILREILVNVVSDTVRQTIFPQ